MPPLSSNPLRRRLAGGGVALGFGVRLVRGVEIVNLAAGCGYDWLFIDLEHGPASVETAAGIATAALGAGLAPLARVSAADYTTAARILDAGAWGVLMSHVESAADAREAVARLKFPPDGHRSVSYSLAQLGHQPMRQADAARQFNDAMLIVAMIESRKAVEAAGDIAAVPGIDALFVGANDLATDLGVPGDFANPAIANACAQVVSACTTHGKWPALGGVYTEEPLRRYVDLGMRLVLGGTDMALLLEGARQRAEMIRRLC